MTKFEKMFACIEEIVSFILAGMCLGGAAMMHKFGIMLNPEFGFLPDWTAAPIAVACYGIVCLICGVNLIRLNWQ